MNATFALISEALSRFTTQSSPEWAKLQESVGNREIARIEAKPSSITTVDCLFDGEATVVLKDANVVPARVFGRCDGRRCEVERIVVAA